MRRIVLVAFAMTVLAACQAGVTPLSDEDIRALEDGVNEHQAALVASDFDVLRRMARRTRHVELRRAAP